MDLAQGRDEYEDVYEDCWDDCIRCSVYISNTETRYCEYYCYDIYSCNMYSRDEEPAYNSTDTECYCSDNRSDTRHIYYVRSYEEIGIDP